MLMNVRSGPETSDFGPCTLNFAPATLDPADRSLTKKVFDSLSNSFGFATGCQVAAIPFQHQHLRIKKLRKFQCGPRCHDVIVLCNHHEDLRLYRGSGLAQ